MLAPGVSEDEERGGQGDDGGGGGRRESDYGHSDHLVLRPSDRLLTLYLYLPFKYSYYLTTELITLTYLRGGSRNKFAPKAAGKKTAPLFQTLL